MLYQTGTFFKFVQNFEKSQTFLNTQMYSRAAIIFKTEHFLNYPKNRTGTFFEFQNKIWKHEHFCTRTNFELTKHFLKTRRSWNL